MNDSTAKFISFPQLFKSSLKYYMRDFITILLLSIIICVPIHAIEYLISLLLPSGSSVQLKTLNELIRIPIMFIGFLQLIGINFVIKKRYDSPLSTSMNLLDDLKFAAKHLGGFIWVIFLATCTMVVPTLLLTVFLTTIRMLIISINIDIFAFDIMKTILDLLSYLPIIFIAAYICFVPQAFLFKEKKGIQALKYSFTLVKGKYWRVFGLNALMFGIGILFSFGFSKLTSFLPSGYGLEILYKTISSIIAPLAMVYNLLLFLHLDKTQKQAFEEPTRKSGSN